MSFAKCTITTTLTVTGIDPVARTVTLTDEPAIRIHGEITKLLTTPDAPKRPRKGAEPSGAPDSPGIQGATDDPGASS